jgi:hypothetical protein
MPWHSSACKICITSVPLSTQLTLATDQTETNLRYYKILLLKIARQLFSSVLINLRKKQAIFSHVNIKRSKEETLHTHPLSIRHYIGYDKCCKSSIIKFKVCKSVHHRTIQINHQPDATISQFIILTFIYSSTCFKRSPAHHQERNDCSGSLWFYRPNHEHSTAITTIRR